MPGDPFNSYQRIPKISIKETKYKQISHKPFLHVENWERNYFVQDKFQKFHHIWINENRMSQATPWNPIFLKEEITSAKKQIHEVDHPWWLSKIILTMELCSIRGSLQQFKKWIFAFSPRTKAIQVYFLEEEIVSPKILFTKTQ